MQRANSAYVSAYMATNLNVLDLISTQLPFEASNGVCLSSMLLSPLRVVYSRSGLRPAHQPSSTSNMLGLICAAEWGFSYAAGSSGTALRCAARLSPDELKRARGHLVVGHVV